MLPSIIWLFVGLGLGAIFAVLYAGSTTEFLAGFTAAALFTVFGSLLMYVTQRPFGRAAPPAERPFVRYRVLAAFAACAPLVILTAFWLVTDELLYLLGGAGFGITLGVLSILNWKIGRKKLEDAGFRW